MHHHHYHKVEMKVIEGKKLPFLNNKQLENGEIIDVMFPNHHKQEGKILLDSTCCANEVRPFLPVCYQGTNPWVYLVGMKARRI